jgi:hypothetical protein
MRQALDLAAQLVDARIDHVAAPLGAAVVAAVRDAAQQARLQLQRLPPCLTTRLLGFQRWPSGPVWFLKRVRVLLSPYCAIASQQRRAALAQRLQALQAQLRARCRSAPRSGRRSQEAS